MTVRFTSVRDIREFVGLATLQSFPVHVADGDGSTAADGNTTDANGTGEIARQIR